MLYPFLNYCLFVCLIIWMSSCASGLGLQGTVTDDYGQDVSEAKIKATIIQLFDDETINPFETITNSQGVYEFIGLKAGQYKIEVEKVGYKSPAPETNLFTETTIDIDFQLRKQLTLIGTVYDTDGETPVLEATVIIGEILGDNDSKLIATLKTDTNGQFKKKELYCNKNYTVTALKDQRRVSKTIRLDNNPDIQLILPRKKESLGEKNDELKLFLGGPEEILK